MTKVHKLDPDRLTALLRRSKMTQKQLAEVIKVDIGTLSRWARGKTTNIRNDKIAKLCEALGTTPEVLCGEAPLPEVPGREPAPRGQITLKLDTACRNALGLMARRYNVTREQIVEIAPLLFFIAAEQSLAKRREQVQGYGVAPAHLRKMSRKPDEDDLRLLEAEERSIAKRDLFATDLGIWPNGPDDANPFARFLGEKLSQTNTPLKGLTWDAFAPPRYQIGIEELVGLLGDDKEACSAVLTGKVALAEMPGDVRRSAPEKQAAWVKRNAAESDKAIKATLAGFDPAALDTLEIDKIAKAMRNHEEDKKHDL